MSLLYTLFHPFLVYNIARWGWKIETLEPGEKAVVEYSLSNLEKGDWTETEVFFRGSQDVIGATKLDEKMLVEIRKQEEVLNQSDAPSEESERFRRR